MGFTKLDSGIVNSSIWSEPASTRVLWITMLAMSDESGFVPCSIPGLIRSANITNDEFKLGIAALESADEFSRTKEHDGKRVAKIEGGWVILNYPKYREREDRDAHREYMRNWRKNKSRELTVNHCESRELTVESLSASVSSSSSSSSSSELRKDKSIIYSSEFLLFWSQYPKKVGKGAAWKEWQKENPPIDACLKTLAWQVVSKDWTKDNGKFIVDPERWIKRRRWEDEQVVTIVPPPINKYDNHNGTRYVQY